MTFKVLMIYFLILTAFGLEEPKASDWKALVDLRGNWSFTVGDNLAWADPSCDISDWDRIPAPGAWERYYEGYNGYGWYRKNFDAYDLPQKEYVDLFLGYIDDVDEVFVNGHRVGQRGQFPPNIVSAYDQQRHYLVPRSWLKETKNLIAVRVYDMGLEGGIVRADKLGFYYDRQQQLMRVDLTGAWRFSTKDQGQMHSMQKNDDQWDVIYAPMTWEDQGYADYDGRAWYRKRFTIPESLKGKELYLVLGKIDDFDDVYLNGELIGKVSDLEGYSYRHKNQAYRLFRIYKLPANLIRSKNLLSVEVEDVHGQGGIYEGPLGITDAGNIKNFIERNRRLEQENSGWKSFFESLIRFVD